MSQLSYPVDQPIAIPGLLADLNDSNFINSLSNEELAAMEYGIAVIDGTADDQMLRVTNAAQPIAGVTVHSHANDIVNDLNLIQPKDTGNVLHRGTIYVQVEDAVAKGAAPFCRVLAPGVEVIGAFRSDADAGNARQLSNARFASSAAAGEFAILEFTELSALL